MGSQTVLVQKDDSATASAIQNIIADHVQTNKLKVDPDQAKDTAKNILMVLNKIKFKTQSGDVQHHVDAELEPIDAEKKKAEIALNQVDNLTPVYAEYDAIMRTLGEGFANSNLWKSVFAASVHADYNK